MKSLLSLCLLASMGMLFMVSNHVGEEAVDGLAGKPPYSSKMKQKRLLFTRV